MLAAKSATTTIPIVFSSGGDPVRMGFVDSINRPGGNVTGVNVLTAVMEGKRLGLLRELVPGAAPIAVLLNPNNPPNKTQLTDIQQGDRSVDQQIQVLHASTERELDMAFASLAKLGAKALLVGADPFFNSRREQVVTLATSNRIPAIYEQREFAVAGGLMSYGTSLTEAYRQVGNYTGRILKGEKPADLPVMQPTSVRVRDQPEDSEGARPRGPPDAARARRRGDRVTCNGRCEPEWRQRAKLWDATALPATNGMRT